jgi:hypothetical protein
VFTVAFIILALLLSGYIMGNRKDCQGLTQVNFTLNSAAYKVILIFIGSNAPEITVTKQAIRRRSPARQNLINIKKTYLDGARSGKTGTIAHADRCGTGMETDGWREEMVCCEKRTGAKTLSHSSPVQAGRSSHGGHGPPYGRTNPWVPGPGVTDSWTTYRHRAIECINCRTLCALCVSWLYASLVRGYK